MKIMIFNDNNENFEKYIGLYSWWGAILILEMMILTWCTGQIRVRTETIHSDEDRRWLKNPNVTIHPNGDGHPEVERIRSIHLYDLETIIPFLLITPVWLMTSPSSFLVETMIRIFSLCKIIHTMIFMNLIGAKIEPTIFLNVCYYVLFYICISTIFFYINFMNN